MSTVQFICMDLTAEEESKLKLPTCDSSTYVPDDSEVECKSLLGLTVEMEKMSSEGHSHGAAAN